GGHSSSTRLTPSPGSACSTPWLPTTTWRMPSALLACSRSTSAARTCCCASCGCGAFARIVTGPGRRPAGWSPRPTCPSSSAPKAAAARTDAGYGSDADGIIAEAVAKDAGPAVARLFVERAAARGDWSFVERLPSLLKRGEVGREMLYAAVDALALPAHRSRLHDVLRRLRRGVRAAPPLWAEA